MEKKHVIYKITNKINGKIYIGAHSTYDIDDEYMGSGKAIKAAITKHGRHNFIKEIIEYVSDEDLLYKREAEIVTSAFAKRPDTYNMIKGGLRFRITEDTTVKNTIWITDGKKNKRIPREENIPTGWEPGRCSGSIKGRVWITNGIKTKRVDPDNIPEGWWQESKQKRLKKTWYTDGSTNLFIPNGEFIPEGFQKGRTVEESWDQSDPEYRKMKSEQMKEYLASHPEELERRRRQLDSVRGKK